MTPRATAAVFDMDGTMVDNMRYHAVAWSAFVRGHGLDVPVEVFEKTHAGRKNLEILHDLFGAHLARDVADRMAEEKERAYRDLYRPHLAPLPGLLPLLDRLERAGIGRAVATAAPPGNRELVLDGLDLRRRFACVIGAEDAPRGKPAPDIFLAAARRLGADPAGCVVFEDAINGVLAGVAAGMAVVGVATVAASPEALARAGATWVVRDFTTLPRELEDRLFGQV